MTTWQDVLRPGDANDFFSRVALPPFEPDARHFVPGNALWLAELSRLIYRHDIEETPSPLLPTRRGFLDKVGLVQRRFFAAARTGTQAMLVTSGSPPEFAVLVFRGTEAGVADYLTDANLGLRYLSPRKPRAHQGFHNALSSVWPQIAPELAALRCPVFYTGHSLGAALATLAALRHEPQAVYNFGAPRVGNRALSQVLSRMPIYRLVDAIDVVAMVPPRILGFRHAGQEVRLSAPAKPASARRFPGFPSLREPPSLLADHAPVNYIDRMPTLRMISELASKTV